MVVTTASVRKKNVELYIGEIRVPIVNIATGRFTASIRLWCGFSFYDLIERYKLFKKTG